MKLSDRLMALVEEKLEDKEAVSRLKEKILAPSLSILKEEINRSGTNDHIAGMVHQLLWPLILIVVAILVLCLIVLALQLYICLRSREV